MLGEPYFPIEGGGTTVSSDLVGALVGGFLALVGVLVTLLLPQLLRTRGHVTCAVREWAMEYTPPMTFSSVKEPVSSLKSLSVDEVPTIDFSASIWFLLTKRT